MLTVISCPECEAPAEVTDRFSLTSTDGPVDCVAVSCLAGHHFRMPSELLSADSREQLRPREGLEPAAGVPGGRRRESAAGGEPPEVTRGTGGTGRAGR